MTAAVIVPKSKSHSGNFCLDLRLTRLIRYTFFHEQFSVFIVLSETFCSFFKTSCRVNPVYRPENPWPCNDCDN